MAISYASPGVYVEEVQRAIRPIQALGTSLTAFVGITEEASTKQVNRRTGEVAPLESRLNKATLVSNWTEYSRVFGGFVDGAYMPDAVYNHFSNGGGPCYVMSLRAIADSDRNMQAATVTVPGTNGKDSFTATAVLPGDAGNNLTLTITDEIDDKGKETGTFTLTIGTETIKGLTMKRGDNNIGNATLSTITVSDVGTTTAHPVAGSYQLIGGGQKPLGVQDFIGDSLARTGINGLEAIEDVRLVACPDLMTGYDGSDEANTRIKAVQDALVGHCERMRYRFAVLDTPPGLNAQEAREWRNFLGLDTSYAALYYPWIETVDLKNGGRKLIPPSGHMTGVYNRVDAERGVHKAPANEAIRGATGLEIQLSRGEQDILNPIGVNCIRAFPGRGIRVWGARTLSSDGAWRYISVRRLFIMVSASMDAGLQWVVFEPNNTRLWARIRRDVTAFLQNVWRSGGLFGDNESQAFYVKCDEELNPEEVRDMGQLIIEVGIAPVKPAEFIIFRLSQWSWIGGEDDEGDEGGGEESSDE